MLPQSNHSDNNRMRSIEESSERPSDVGSETLNAAMSGIAKPCYKDFLKAQRNLHRHQHHHYNSPPTSSSTMNAVPEAPALRRQKTDEDYQHNLQAMAAAGQRNSLISDTSLWDAIMQSPHAEASGSFQTAGRTSGSSLMRNGSDHDHGHGGRVPYYAPPMQRVFYGKPQVLPHVNWGDLFFDLFFVAAAYNLGTMLISSLTPEDWLRGTIYFVGIFGSLFQTWYNDLAFSSRYTVLDHVHRLIWALKFFSVAGAIMFITPISLMADPHSFETLGFIAAILLEAIISTALQVEVYFKAVGDRVPIEKHSLRILRTYHLPTLIMYTAALVLAILAYPKEADYGTTTDAYGNSTSSGTYGERRDLAAATDVSCSTGSRLLLARMLGATEVNCSDGHRFLAAASDGCSCHTGALLEIKDLPLGIICFAYFFNIFFSLFRSMCLASRAGKDIRDRFVPNNLDYVIHRYGEWIMLMIGESVLSLLIVETVESTDYFIIACYGVLNVMCVHTLIFESQPSTSAGHAIFRSFKGQLSFGLLVQVLSMGLIAFGVCFKIMLSTVLAEASSYSSYRRRELAGAVSVSTDKTATLFCISLTTILVTLELMLVTHKGTKETFARLWKNRDGGSNGVQKKIHKPLLALNIIKIGLIVFVATLSQWETELTAISWIGLLVVFSIWVTRIVAWGLVHREDEIREFFANGLNAVMPKKQEQAPINDIEKGTYESVELAVHRNAWDQSDECIVVCNKDGGIKYANKKALAEFGYKSELDLIGKDIGILAKDGNKEDRRKGLIAISQLESRRDSWNDSMDMVVVIDRNGIIQFANQMTLQEFGYGSEEELIGKDIAVLVVGGGEAMNHGEYVKAMEAGKIASKVIGNHRASSNKKRPLYAKRKDGKEFPCLIGLKPIGDDYIACYIKDLSDLASMQNYNKDEFITAASEGDAEEVKRFLANSSVLMNEGGYDKRTALHLAAQDGHEEVVQILCEAGADVNVEDRWGHRPLDDAIWGQHKECVALLRKFGAKRGIKRTVNDLIGASAKGSAEEVKTIVEEGDADINGCDYDGQTSLHLAAIEGHVAVVEILCKAGAKLDASDRWHRTPLDEAELHGQMACKEMLLKFGAKGKSESSDDISISARTSPEVLEETADSIIVSNYDGVIQKLNTTALASFGYESDVELIGQNISILVQDEFVGRKSFGGSLQSQRVSHGKHKSGSKFPCIVQERKDQQRHLLISYIKDVSDLTTRGSITISQNDLAGFKVSTRASGASVNLRESLHDI